MRLLSFLAGLALAVGVAHAIPVSFFNSTTLNYLGASPTQAFDYDGTNDYAARGANLTGAADGKQGTISIWFRVDGGAGTRRTLFSTYAGGAFLQAELTATNTFTFVGNDGTANRISIGTSGTFAVGSTWHNVSISYDLAATTAHLYADGASDLVTTTLTNNTLDYTTGNAAIGALPSDGSLKWNGALSEVFVHVGAANAYIDLSVEGNRQKFVGANGKPVYLGADGARPLGVQPLIYAPSGNPSTNVGGGGNLTVTGTLDAASTSPFSVDNFTAFNVEPGHLSDNGYSDDLGLYYETSAFSRLVVTTAATAVKVGFYVDADVYALGATYSRVGVWDGSTFQSIQPTAAGWNTGALTLAAGTKTVQVVNGIRVGFAPPDPPEGSHLINAVFYDTATLVGPTTPANRILVYGDSIATGSVADPITTNAWSMKLRQLYAPTGSVMQESWNGRGLFHDGVDAAARQAFVDHIAGYAPSIIWLAVGANDYYRDGGLWSAASFETAYADLLDKLHTALPNAAIYAQTPIVMTSEAANANFANTLGNYRTAISNACSGRAWATLVDGTTFVLTTDLADGIHPNNAGHTKVYDAVKAELGL